MTDIPSSLPSSVVSLDMTKNSIRLLTSASLKNLPNLLDLKLRENSIETISEGTFDDLKSLQTLDLSTNNLALLNESFIFRATGKLVHLDISHNRLRAVAKAFDGLVDLSRLDLRQNLLTSIGRLTFRGLTNLRYLRLDDNRIEHIEREAFGDLEKLMYFVIKGNPIGHLETIYFNSQLLSYVDMSECDLTRIPKGMPNSLRYLQLRRNKMAVLNRHAFADCNDVTIIVLDENEIVEIEPRTLEETRHLQQLWLNGNRLRSVPRSLPSSVQRLFLDSNELQSLTEEDMPIDSQMNTLSLMSNNISYISPTAFHRLTNLKSLDLSGNPIERLYSQTFSANSQLQILQLSKTQLEILDSGCFHGLTELKTLSMAYLPTTVMSMYADVFMDMTNLKKLDLDSSPGLIRSVLASDEILSSLSSIQDLNLQNSEIVKLRQYIPDFFPKLTVLHISSSSWHCDSELIWLRNWLLSYSIHIEHRDRNRCLTPRSVYDRPITSLSDSDFIPAPNKVTSSSTHSTITNTRLHGTTTSLRELKDDVASTKDLTDLNVSRNHRYVDSDHGLDKFSPSAPDARVPSTASSPIPPHSKASQVDGVLTWDEILSHISLTDFDSKLFESNERYIELLNNSPEKETRSKTQTSKHINRIITTSKQFTFSSSAFTVAATNVGIGGNLVSGNNAVNIVIITVLITTFVASILISIIVCLCLKRKRSLSSQKRSSLAATERLPFQNGSKMNGKRDMLYFMTPSSGKRRGDLGNPITVLAAIDDNTNGIMSLIPGRDINHEGPMRVYKWEDF